MTAKEPLVLKAINAWDPAIPVAVGLMAQAIQPSDEAGVDMKAMEREEIGPPPEEEAN